MAETVSPDAVSLRHGLDEPSLGLAPAMIGKIFHTIRVLPAVYHCGILLVEQNTQIALAVADFGYVPEAGVVVPSGAASELAQNPQVRQAYLGGDLTEV